MVLTSSGGTTVCSEPRGQNNRITRSGDNYPYCLSRFHSLSQGGCTADILSSCNIIPYWSTTGLGSFTQSNGPMATVTMKRTHCLGCTPADAPVRKIDPLVVVSIIAPSACFRLQTQLVSFTSYSSVLTLEYHRRNLQVIPRQLSAPHRAKPHQLYCHR